MKSKDLDGAWRPLLTRRLLVNLRPAADTPDRAIRGVLWDQRGPLLILKSAELIETGQQVRRVDGEVVIERRNVDFVQVLPNPED
jgi:hypothetical protein